MAELAAFVDYEKEFTLLTNSLPTRINALLNYESSNDAAATELRRIKGEMSQAKQLAMDMEIAARGIGEPTRRELGNKIRIHKETLQTLQKDLSGAEAKFDRAALVGGRAAAAPLDFDKSGASRDRMGAATDKLRSGTTALGDAHRRLEETIEVGAGVMSELDRNRETLQRVRSNVGEVSGTLDTARRLLRGMSRREVQNKIAVAVFALVMLGIIGVVICALRGDARRAAWRRTVRANPNHPASRLPRRLHCQAEE